MRHDVLKTLEKNHLSAFILEYNFSFVVQARKLIVFVFSVGRRFFLEVCKMKQWSAFGHSIEYPASNAMHSEFTE